MTPDTDSPVYIEIPISPPGSPCTVQSMRAHQALATIRCGATHVIKPDDEVEYEQPSD